MTSRISIAPYSASAPRAFWYVAASISVIVLAANTPIPLFTLYQSEWGFSTGMLTVVYSVYTAGVIAAVFLLGPISDSLGRRRVLVPAIVTMIAGLTVCLFSRNVAMLIGGRVLQGVSIGAGVTTAVSALGDLHPDGKTHGRVALVATVATVVGLAGGPLVAGLLAQYAPQPTVLPYVISLVLVALALFGILATPENVRTVGRARFLPRGIAIPKAIRRPFFLATYVETTAYAVAGTFAGLGASFTRDLLHLKSHAAAGLLVALLFISSTFAQLILRAWTYRRSMFVGLATLAAGLAVLVVALHSGSPALFFFATMILGAGHGLSYLGAQELIDRIAPPDSRAKIFAGFQLGLYVGASAPSLAVGFAAAAIGFANATLAFIVAASILTFAGLLWVASLRNDDL